MTGEEILDRVRLLINDTTYARYDEINDAYEEMCRITNFYWLRESDEDIITFKDGVKEYYIDTSEMRRLERIWVFGVESTKRHWHLMKEVDQELFEDKKTQATKSDGTDDEDRPSYYKLEGGPLVKLTVTPTPDQDYTGRIDYIEHVPEITRNSEIKLPAAYHRTLAQLAAGYILEMSPDQQRAQLGQVYIQRAQGVFQDVVADSHPNRIGAIDPQPITWIK